MKTYRKFVREAKGKTAVFAFGRMNPPTVGHAKLIMKVMSVAKKGGGVPMVFPSKTEDKKKNPLSFDTKVKVLKDVFGNVINTDTSIRTPFDVLDSLNNANYEKVVFVVGSDRVNEFKRGMSKFVNSNLDNIKDFSVISAGDRDPDAEGVAGMSGSKMRDFVIKDKFSKFKEGLLTKNARLAKVAFKEIGKKLKIKKENYNASTSM
ncbi:MAG TPA: hypothetical protein EYG21_09410 [Nitrospinaceae bacterium]|jgi:hypothetical protein|nr:hypothetical protein [Nitrospinaceae bacterium]